MNEEERREAIERWATYIIPAVFRGEDELMKKHPEWKDKLAACSSTHQRQHVMMKYCKAIAEEIVSVSFQSLKN